MTSSSTGVYKNNAFQSTNSTTTSFAWYDGAVQSLISYKPNTSQSTTWTTTYTYSGSGVLTGATIADGRPRTLTVTSDALGQVIRRDEADNVAWNATNSTGGDPHEAWYRFNGRQLGYSGNNGTLDVTDAASIAQRTAVSAGSGAFRNGATTASAYADFDQSYDPINSYAQGSSAGVYTVRTGDTLSSIAAQLWGDAALWYKLAQANASAPTTG